MPGGGGRKTVCGDRPLLRLERDLDLDLCLRRCLCLLGILRRGGGSLRGLGGLMASCVLIARGSPIGAREGAGALLP